MSSRKPKPGCQVTVDLTKCTGGWHPLCGLPVVKYGLCAQHYADRIRLGGQP
jgi:hypothetical protein